MQPTKKTKKRKRPKLAESDGEKKKGRGAKQREKRRAQKAAAEERAKAKNQKQQMRAQMQEVAKTERQLNRKKRPRQLPDADPNPAKVKRRGELQDDFELRAVERFRRGKIFEEMRIRCRFSIAHTVLLSPSFGCANCFSP